MSILDVVSFFVGEPQNALDYVSLFLSAFVLSEPLIYAIHFAIDKIVEGANKLFDDS